jgi:hypothetical protein
MMATNILAALSLSLAIALSWSRFRPIFSSSTNVEILRAPATTLASAICLSALGLAFNDATLGAGGLIVALGFLLPFVLARIPVRTSTEVSLSLASVLLMFHIWIAG